ncbi:hypothetical protein HK405_006373 [Cladochytrium tenue]|nr:hypothetical protein HK405_006373 [Cladochytrium tenue]
MDRTAIAANDPAPTTMALVPPAEPVPFVPWPAWPPALAAVVHVTRSKFHAFAGNLAYMRLVNSDVTTPTPPGVVITPTAVPRRADVLLEDMTPADAVGSIPAEWVDFRSVPSTAADMATPESKRCGRGVVLFIHGGGFVSMSARMYRTMTWRLSKYAGTKVLAIDYRLAPENVFPLPLHDVISAYLYLTAPAGTGGAGYKPSEVFVVGDSAGGGMVFSLLLWLRDNAARAFGLPAGACTMSPWLDLTQSMPSTRVNGPHDIVPFKMIDTTHETPRRSHYYVADNAQLAHPLVSPLFAREGQGGLLPPLLVQAGDCERFRDEILLVVRDRFPASPIHLELYEGMVHDFQLFAPALAIGEAALRRVGKFARACLDPVAADQSTFKRHMTFVELASSGRTERVLTNEDVDEILQKSREKLIAISKPSEKALRSRI